MRELSLPDDVCGAAPESSTDDQSRVESKCSVTNVRRTRPTVPLESNLGLHDSHTLEPWTSARCFDVTVFGVRPGFGARGGTAQDHGGNSTSLALPPTRVTRPDSGTTPKLTRIPGTAFGQPSLGAPLRIQKRQASRRNRTHKCCRRTSQSRRQRIAPIGNGPCQCPREPC